MKTKILFLLLIIIALIFVQAKTILGSTPPTFIEKFCEFKSGQIFSYDDGFSALDICPKNSREVVLYQEPAPQIPLTLKILDGNGSELGIYADPLTFFYPSLNAFIPVNNSNGKLGYPAYIYYTEANCQGIAYVKLEEPLQKNNSLILTPGGSEIKYFMISKVVDGNIEVSSAYYQGSCAEPEEPSLYSPGEIVDVSDKVLLPKSVTLPLQYRYQ